MNSKTIPIKVANEQCGTVGINSILIKNVSSWNGSTCTPFSQTTFSCSSVSDFSGSWMDLIRSLKSIIHLVL